MPQTITIIRHAETKYNLVHRVQGHIDVHLSDGGKVQAAKLAARFKPETIDAIYTSDLARAWQTAELINSHHQVPLKKTKLLRERFLGRLEGMQLTSQRELAKQQGYTGQFAEWNYEFVISMGGELKDSINQRLKRFWIRIKKRHPHQHIVIVSHGGVIPSLIQTITQSVETIFPRLDNTSVTRLVKSDSSGQYDIKYSNDITHLYYSPALED